MIAFLNWTHFSEPFEPDAKQTGLTAKHMDRNESKRTSFSSNELVRAIARWENEGGAVPQRTQSLLS